jgi:uncharacterized protein (TIGR00251 family)
VKVTAAPEKGKANSECQRILAGIFDISKNQVVLLSGEKNQHKTFILKDMQESKFMECLKESTGEK